MASTVACNNVWTLQSLDTAAVGRLHDGAFLPSLSTVPNQQYRAGVIPTVMTSPNAAPIDLLVLQTTVASMGCLVGSGNAVVANASRGPYTFSNPTNGVALTLATSNPTNPRIDLVYVQVIDNPPDTGTTGGIIGVVTGTAAASPTVPALPSNGVCIPLAQILVGANVTSITNSNITDVRKSSGPSPRFMLPGDALSDPGFRAGELRQRSVASYPIPGTSTPAIFTDYWGFDAAWHGTVDQPITPVWQNGTSNIPMTTANTNVTLWQFTIPDPGWKYEYTISASQYALVTNGGVMSLQVHEVTASGTNVYNGFDNSISGNNLIGRLVEWTSGPKTGALNVFITAQATIASSTAVFAGGGTQASMTVSPV